MLAFHSIHIHRLLRQLSARLGEVLHLSAIYFGIAALMILLSMWLVPSTREQTEQIYASVVNTLRPVGWAQHRSLVLRAEQLQEFSDKKNQAMSSSCVHPTGSQLDGKAAVVAEQFPNDEEKQSAYTEFAQSLELAAGPIQLAGVTQAQYQALQSYIARKYRVAYTAVGALIDLAYQEAANKALDPLLILAVIAIESSYNPFAESGVGAQGLMQIMTKVHEEKFVDFSEGTLAVFSPDANIKIGVQILADCLKRRGSIDGALACYVGATGPGDGGYGKRVLAERNRIALASGIAIQDEAELG